MNRGLTQRVIARLQRISWRPPRRVRSLVHRALTPTLNRTELNATEWTSPLINRGQVFEPLEHLTREEVVEPEVADAIHPRSSLRCLLVTGGLNMGGLGEVVTFLASGLPTLGVEVMVVDCVAESGDARTVAMRREIERAGVRVVGNVSEPTGLATAIDWRPDVISGHGAPDWVLDIAIREGIPYVDNIHGMHDYLNGVTSKQLMRHERVSMFVAVSELVRQQFLDVDASVPSDRVVAIPNGLRAGARQQVDRERARRVLGLEDEFVFVSLARYALQKNITGLVGAFGAVARACPDSHLVVAAHVEDRFHLLQSMALKDDSGARDRIHLRGHTTSPAVLLAAADGFVLDSFFEGGCPLAAIEALHSGLPVVMSEVGGAVEQIGTDGARGHIVANPLGHTRLADWDTMRRVAYGRQYNTAELREAMIELAEQRELWRDRRSAIRLDAMSRFSAEACLEAHANVLRRATSGVADLATGT